MRHEDKRATRATRIVATIASNAEKRGALAALLDAGVDVVRLNGAHCRPGEILRRVAIVRKVEKKLACPIGVLLDLGGPKIRVGPVSGGGVIWTAGDKVEIVPGGARGGDRKISVTYPD